MKPAPESKSQILAEFAVSLQHDSIPAEVSRKARNLFMDTIGIAFGASQSENVEKMIATLSSVEGTGMSTLIGRTEELSVSNAALINSMMAHSLDYDDTHLPTIVHSSAVLVPVGLAVAEHAKSDGKALITALVAGYEVMTRVGLATAPAQVSGQGRMPTGVWGSFGAATVAGKLLGLTAKELSNALRLAAATSSLVRTDKIHSTSWVAHGGLMAAVAAGADSFDPRIPVLEGDRSIYYAAVGSAEQNGEEITSELGERWETENVCPKTYACCHSHQGFMDAARLVRQKYGISAEDIDRVECVVPEFTWQNRLEPAEEKRRPQSAYAAKFSVPFGVALMLSRGRAGLTDFSATSIVDPEVLNIVDRISFRLESENWSGFPNYFSGWIELDTTDGRHIVEKVPYNRGSARNPLPDAEYEEKFLEASGEALSTERQLQVLRAISHVEDYNIEQFAKILRG